MSIYKQWNILMKCINCYRISCLSMVAFFAEKSLKPINPNDTYNYYNMILDAVSL